MDDEVLGWQDHPRWGRVPLLDLDEGPGWERLVVVAAHPDDESIGAGGLIARAHARGLAVYVALLTAGEAADATVADGSRHALARLRLGEMEQAVAGLAPGAPVAFLGAQDGRVEDCEQQVAGYLTETLGQGSRTLVAAPWREDPHADHRAAGRAAAAAARAAGARLLEYPVRLWLDAGPQDAPWDRFHRLDLAETEREAKRAAIAAHASQLRAPGPGGRLAHLAGSAEHYVVDDGGGTTPAAEA